MRHLGSPNPRIHFWSCLAKNVDAKSQIVKVKFILFVWQASRSYDESDSTNPEKKSAFEERQRESLLRPTPEMKRILARRAGQEIRRQSLSRKDQLAEYNQRSVFFFI